MKTWKKILTGLIAIGAFGTFVYLLTSGFFFFYFNDIDTSPLGIEKLAITNAYVNGSTVLLDVRAIEIQRNATFSGIVFKDANTGNVIDDALISDSLLENETKTISINLKNPLASGNYTATLITAKGSCFVSPSFTVP